VGLSRVEVDGVFAEELVEELMDVVNRSKSNGPCPDAALADALYPAFINRRLLCIENI
jgi:hypothetical protein